MLKAIACAALVAAASAGQVHVALGFEHSTMSVAWTTTNASGTSEVQWGLSPTALDSKATGDIRNFTMDPGRVFYTRTANMTGLQSDTKYYYKVGDAVNGFSEVFSVMNHRTSAPYRHVLFGDMGAYAAFSLCSACEQYNLVCDESSCAANTSVGLVSEVDTADMFLHVGDFAYDFADKNGVMGDHFMQNIEQVAARVPYMVSHGNHEDSAPNLAHFIETFRSQPSNAVPALFETGNGVTTNTMYFSWDHGLVHYISFSSEFWYNVSSENPAVNAETFLAWLVADLEAANKNRDAYPWILIHDHRPLYSSAGDDSGSDLTLRKALEEIFFNYGIDISVNGHQHDYERSWPTYDGKSQTNYTNPTATVYIVTGAAGSPEMHSPFSGPAPAWSAFRSNTFGYTRMIVHNASHINFQQVMTDPTDFPMGQYGEVIDDWWMVQASHGPFNKTLAPTEVANCPPSVCKTIDHFEPFLADLRKPTDTRPLYQIIADYIKDNGEEAWVRRLDKLMAHFNKNSGKKAEWEDGNLNNEEARILKWLHSNSQ